MLVNIPYMDPMGISITWLSFEAYCNDCYILLLGDSERSWDGDGASVASNKSDNDLLFNVSMQLGLFTLW